MDILHRREDTEIHFLDSFLRRGRERLGQIQREVTKSRERLQCAVRKQSSVQVTDREEDNASDPNVEFTRIQSSKIPVLQKILPESSHDDKGGSRSQIQLERLEKAVAQNSLREVLRRRRDMAPIVEELDIAFTNMTYSEVSFPRQPGENGTSQYETIYCGNMNENEDYDYESYDFGEEGIYQNIIFQGGKSMVSREATARQKRHHYGRRYTY